MESSTSQKTETASSLVKPRITLFLFLLSFVTYLDRVNIAIAGVPLSRQFGFSDVQLGAIFSAFVLGYSIFQIPTGWLGDRFGHKRLLIGALLWWSVFTAATGIAGKGFLPRLLGVTVSFWLVRFLIGAGESATYPCGNGLIAEWIDPARRGLAAGVMFAGIGVGTAFTPPLIVWIMVHWGWEYAFYLSSLAGVALAMGFYLQIPARTASVAGQKHPRAEVRRDAGQQQLASRAPGGIFRQALLRNRHLWLLTLGMVLFGYVMYVYYFWLYYYLSEVRHLPLVRGSLAASLPFLAMAVSAPSGGWLGDRLASRLAGARRLIAVVGLISAAIFIPLGAGSRHPVLAVAFLSLGAGSMYLSVSSYFVVALEIAPAHSGAVIGIINMGANVGGVISPTLTPWIANRYGWFAALCLAAVFSLIAALLWMLMKPRQHEAAYSHSNVATSASREPI